MRFVSCNKMWEECEETITSLQERDVPQSWNTDLLNKSTVPKREYTIAALSLAWEDKCTREASSIQRQLQEIFALVNLDPWATVLIDTNLAPIILSKLSTHSLARIYAEIPNALVTRTYGFTWFDYASFSVYCTVVLTVIVLICIHCIYNKLTLSVRNIITNVLLSTIGFCVIGQIIAHTGFEQYNSVELKKTKINGLSRMQLSQSNAVYNGKKFTVTFNLSADLNLTLNFSDTSRSFLIQEPFNLTMQCVYSCCLPFSSFSKRSPSSYEEVLQTLDKETNATDIKVTNVTINLGSREIAYDILKLIESRFLAVFDDRITPTFKKCCDRMLKFVEHKNTKTYALHKK